MKIIPAKATSKSFRLAALVSCFFLSHVVIIAQDVKPYDVPKNEVSVSYGVSPLSALFSDFGHGIATGLSAGSYTTENEYLGVINIDYTRHVTKWLGIGVNLSYSHNLVKEYLKDSSPNGSSLYSKENDHYWTFMPTVKFNWFRRTNIAMYSRLSAGVTMQYAKRTDTDSNKKDEKETSWLLNGQLSPFGIEVGSNQCRAFAELGIGQAGLLHGGFRYRF